MTVELVAMAAVLHINDGTSSRCNVRTRAGLDFEDSMKEGGVMRDEARIYRAKTKLLMQRSTKEGQ